MKGCGAEGGSGNFCVRATILADWQGAPPPPKNDRQMLSSIQPIFPGGQFWRSMPNRTAFRMAVDTMEYLDYYSVQADTFCIMCESVGPFVSRITHAGSSSILICCDAPLGLWVLRTFSY